MTDHKSSPEAPYNKDARSPLLSSHMPEDDRNTQVSRAMAGCNAPYPDADQSGDPFITGVPICADPDSIQRAPIVKKPKSKRRKSPYRDAKFRPLFQAVAALQDLQANGGTSVTYCTPSHPFFSILRLKASLLPSLSSSGSFQPEALSDEDEERVARFWRDYAIILHGLPNYRKPAEWRDLSDVASLEWYHNAMRHSGPYMAFTLNLDAEVEAQIRTEENAAAWLSERIDRQLKDALGRKVNVWFGFELSPERRLHAHGELGIAENEAEISRKALRLAGGEWDEVRQHQAKTRSEPSLPWANYCGKASIFIRPLSGRFADLPRAINGDWLFASNTVRSTAGELYDQQREKVIVLMPWLRTLQARPTSSRSLPIVSPGVS